MQNTGNITLENWQASNEDEANRPIVRHFAIRQTGVSLDFHLKHFFRDADLTLHYFQDLRELLSLCHRFRMSAIFFAGDFTIFDELPLIQAIKNNILLSIVPVILYHPEPEINEIVAAYEAGVEEFIHGEWVDRLVQVRIKSVLDRSARDLSVNPSTRLPGPAMIEAEINGQLTRGDEFALCYADLDNFKAYNDYYGYVYGDRVIQLTGRILRDIVYDLCPEGFVGHIAGDDFVFVVPVDVAEEACRWVIRNFDSLITHCYQPEDIERGYIETKNRAGDLEHFAKLTISIAVVVNRNRAFKHIGEFSKMLADLKKAAKAKVGSNYMIERRKKY